MTAMGSNPAGLGAHDAVEKAEAARWPACDAQPELSEQSNAVAPGRPGPSGTASAGPEIAECSETVGCSGSARCYDPASTWSCPPASASESALPFDLVTPLRSSATQSTPSHRFQGGHCAPVMSRMMTPSVSLDRLGHISH